MPGIDAHVQQQGMSASTAQQPQTHAPGLQTGPRPPRRVVASHAVGDLQLLSPDCVSWQQRLPLASWPPTLLPGRKRDCGPSSHAEQSAWKKRHETASLESGGVRGPCLCLLTFAKFALQGMSVELWEDDEEDEEDFFLLLGISDGMLLGKDAKCAGAY